MTRPLVVVVVGDVINDIIVRPQGPIDVGTDTPSEVELSPGGSGANQAAWLAALHTPVRFVGRAGAGDAAHHRAALEQLGVEAWLTADQEAQAGLACNGVPATLGHPLPATCLVSQFTSSLISIPAINAENDDHNPPRIAPRSLFDLSFGEDNLLRRRAENKRTLSASMTIVNLTNKYALYNFLSTFSGTHYVTPRSVSAQLAYHF